MSDALHRLANESLRLWDLRPGARARLLHVSENATFLVEAPGGGKRVLRVHREGYHSRNAISWELAWMRALRREAGVFAPLPVAGRDGVEIQSGATEGLARARHMVLFEFVEGRQPQEGEDLREPFRLLGEVCARTHLHALSWPRGAGFERLIWDEAHIFRPHMIWGDWREAPGVGAAERDILERQERVLRERLAAYGKGREVFGLIHADMRLANLLVPDAGGGGEGGGAPRLIDFDDCGLGWHLYDFAAAVSFMEERSDIGELFACWLRGYEGLRRLRPEDKAEMETFVMLRRMALLAWVGTHMHTDAARAAAPGFAAGTAALAENHLRRFG